MIIFENNTKLMSFKPETDNFLYDPLAEFKLELDWTEQKIAVFEAVLKFDYLEVYKRNGLVTEGDYKSLCENAALNVITRIGRVIRNIILTIKDAIIGAFRKLQNYFEDKKFKPTIEKFKANDLTKFKITTKKIKFDRIKELTTENLLYDTFNTFSYGNSDEYTINDLGTLFDKLSAEDKEELIKNINNMDAEHNKSASWIQVKDKSDEELKNTIHDNSFYSKDKEEINGFSSQLKADYINGYENCRKAIETSIRSYNKLVIAYQGIENGFKRNTKKDEYDATEYAAILKVLSDCKSFALKESKLLINDLRYALVLIKKVISKGAIGVINAEDDPINVDIKEAATTDEVDKLEDVDDAIEDPEDIDEDLEEVTKNDIKEYYSLMELFSAY